MVAKAGDLVLLIDQERKKFLRILEPGGVLQTHKGTIGYDDLIGLPYGSEVYTHLGHQFYMFRPTTDDLVRALKRKSQIIFPKDLGYIVMKMGLRPGQTVIEAGTGSGGMTLAFAMLLGENGRLISYDRRADMQELARRNLERVGLAGRVTFKLRDISEGFDETDVDALFLDVLTPWEYLEQAHAAMRGGAVLGCLVPTVNQVQRLVRALFDGPWFLVEVEEILLRTYKVIPERIRPEDRMIGHTGYLIFARAVNRLIPKSSESTGDADEPL